MYLKKLAKLRKKNGLTQERLSRDADISYHTLTKIERGVIKDPQISTVMKLAKVLGVKIEELF